MWHMIKPGAVLDIPNAGVRIEMRKTAAETGGELLEFDVVGRARGLFAQEHLHVGQTERHEVIEGSMRLLIDGREHLLAPGDAMEVPSDTPHRQLPGGDDGGRVRVQLRPALAIEEFLGRMASIKLNRWGYPGPVDAAAIVRDFGHEGHATRPSLRVQKAMSAALLRLASREYVFVDEWDVAAPRESVFEAISDARSYPVWWKPVYVGVDADDGEPAVGKESRQHFKGRLPYHLNTRSRITRLEHPHVIAAEVDGDLRGVGEWTLTETATGTHVRFDWRVHADRKLLRILTPILRPAFRWNHAWAIARAQEGLEPYARALRPVAAVREPTTVR
jgi:uncharacterized protein YndB with AHSA1/START domain/mannose-6-phosphate isomerase-like protein (cupin superfamily)